MADRLLLKSMESPEVMEALNDAYPKVLSAPSVPEDAKLKLKEIVVGRDLTRTVEMVSFLCDQDESAKEQVVAAAAQLVTTRLDRHRPSFRPPSADTSADLEPGSPAKISDGWAAAISNISRSLHNNEADVVYGLEDLASPRLGADQTENDRAGALAASIRAAVQEVEPSYFANPTISNEFSRRSRNTGLTL